MYTTCVCIYRYCTFPFFLSRYCLFCPQTLAFWGGQRKVCKAGRHTEARPFGRELRGCARYWKRQPWLNWVSWHTLSLQWRLSWLFHRFFLDPTVNRCWRVSNYAREMRFLHQYVTGWKTAVDNVKTSLRCYFLQSSQAKHNVTKKSCRQSRSAAFAGCWVLITALVVRVEKQLKIHIQTLPLIQLPLQEQDPEFYKFLVEEVTQKSSWRTWVDSHDLSSCCMMTIRAFQSLWSCDANTDVSAASIKVPGPKAVGLYSWCGRRKWGGLKCSS